MRANFDCFVAEIAGWECIPHIIILSEIWINNDEAGFYSIAGFDLFLNANDSYRAGGVAVFVKKGYVTIIEEEKPLIQSADMLRIKFIFNGEIFNLLAIYRLHNYSINLFVNDLQDYFMKTEKNSVQGNFILMGDSNIDILDESQEIDNFKILMASLGFECLINDYTRVTNTTKTCIDNAYLRLTNRGEVDYEAEVIKTQITDHYMTAVRLLSAAGVGGEGDGRSADCPPQPPASPPAPRRRVCYDKLLDLLYTVDWSIVKSQVDASFAYDLFEKQLVTCISACTVDIEIKKPIKKLKPWMTNNICKLIDKRNKLFEKVKFRSADDRFKQYYFRFRNNVKKVIKATKFSYYEKKFENNKGNSKLIWKTVNEIAGQKKTNRNIFLSLDNELIRDPQVVANEFNNYFLSVVEQVVGHNNIDGNFSELPFRYKFPAYTECNSILLGPVLTEDVEKTIKSLKNGKSPGLDGVSSIMLKSIYPAILDVLTFLINLSFQTGVFPEKLKNAVIIPIHKNGSFSLPSNYRPISLISTFAKIYEKIMKQKMLSFLNKINFFSNSQYGFRKGMNTELALLNYMDNITEGINNGECTSGLFLDIRKAFDTVDHNILLWKLHNYGFRGVAYDWFCSYLNKRQQCVRANDVLSYMGEIKYGVPQGSVLGAILFIIFINDFC
jgi:hypothetical protein